MPFEIRSELLVFAVVSHGSMAHYFIVPFAEEFNSLLNTSTKSLRSLCIFQHTEPQLGFLYLYVFALIVFIFVSGPFPYAHVHII